MKKILLILLVLPASVPLLWLTGLGAVAFIPDVFSNKTALFLGFLSITGIFSVIMMVFSAFLYPKVTKLTIFAFIIGIFDLIFGVFVGFTSIPLYLVSACCLLLAGVMLSYQYRLNVQRIHLAPERSAEIQDGR